MRDPGIEENAVENLLDRFRRWLQSKAMGAIGAGEHQRQPGRAVLEIVQRLRVGVCRVGMIDPLHDLPGRGRGAAGDRRGALARADRSARSSGHPTVLPTSFSNGAPFSTPSTSLRQSS